MVMGDTVQRPGGDAAVVRVHGTAKGIAMTTDVTPRYCAADPVVGGRQAVAEAWRNLIAVGAEPLAVTDCLNFGNPERPATMGQLVGCIQGMGEACRALAFPVVSGNVSLYNETEGAAIPPTPTIGGVGLIDNLAATAGIGLERDGDAILLIGETAGHLGASIYLRDVLGRNDGAPPPVDLDVERRNGDLVRNLIRRGIAGAVHDLSDGGLAIAIIEMTLAGGRGATITQPESDLPPHAWLFGEDQARYLVAVDPAAAETVLAEAAAARVPAARIGTTGGDAVAFGATRLPLDRLRAAHEEWFPNYMAAPA
jgi:phosphoribosylformylglycinamidine synthase